MGLVALLLPLAASCASGDAPGCFTSPDCYASDADTDEVGIVTAHYFPIDGEREATYFNEDTELDLELMVEKVSSGTEDGVPVVTFAYSTDVSATIGTVTFSSIEVSGVRIHGYTEGASSTTFDPPIVLTADVMSPGDSIVTSANDLTFTSTHLGFEDCPVYWGLDWEDCLHLRLDDGDGDDDAGPFFAGEYWLVQRYGPAWMHLTGYRERWNLGHYEWREEG